MPFFRDSCTDQQSLLSLHRKRKQTRKPFPGSLTFFEETLKTFRKLEKHTDKLSRLLVELAKEQQYIKKRQVRICKLLPEELNEYLITNACQCDSLKLELVVLLKQADSSMSKNEILQRLNEIVYPERESVQVSAASRRSIKTSLSRPEPSNLESNIAPARKNFLYSKTVEMKREDGAKRAFRKKTGSNAPAPVPFVHQESRKNRRQVCSIDLLENQPSGPDIADGKLLAHTGFVADERFESCPEFAFPKEFRKAVQVRKSQIGSRSKLVSPSRSSSGETEREYNRDSQAGAARHQLSSINFNGNQSSAQLNATSDKLALMPIIGRKVESKLDKLSRTTNNMESRIHDPLQLHIPPAAHSKPNSIASSLANQT